LHLSVVAKLSTSFGWGKGWNVTSAGWQVTLCDPIWHVAVALWQLCQRTAISMLLYFTLPATHVLSIRQMSINQWQSSASQYAHQLGSVPRSHSHMHNRHLTFSRFDASVKLTRFRAFVLSVGAVHVSVTPPRPRDARLGRPTAEMIRTTLYAACKHIAQIYVTISDPAAPQWLERRTS